MIGVSATPARARVGIEELNRRRRTAVRLRLQGRVLRAISQTTGLSVPTILAACKAYEAGGWDAVDVAPRGRRVGAGRMLDDAQQYAVLTNMAEQPPDGLGLGDLLWHADVLRRYLRMENGREPSSRTVERYLERWLWPDPVPRFALADGTSGLGDANAAYRALAKRARAEGGEIYWVQLHTAADWKFIVARSRRGTPYWMGYQGEPGPLEWNIFGERLQRTLAQKIWIIMPQHSNMEGLTANHRVEWVGPDAAAPAPQHASTVDCLTRPVLDGMERRLSHLDRLEAESIHIMREVVAEADNPVMLYSIGKDSSVMLHLALKAFYPAPLPFPLLHVDTRWKFRDMYRFRDQRVREVGARLLTHTNPEGLAQGINPFEHGSAVHTDVMKTQALKQALDMHGFDAAFGGARRDEEKSRAKERIFSFRSAGHRWDPKNQRPELWRLYNARKNPGESLRVFPLSNWTELDIWLYIHRENIPIVPLYFAAPRPVVERDGLLLMVDDDRMPLRPGERPMTKQVRFRTLGCYPLTAAIESRAATLPDIIQEMLLATTSERQGRIIDFDGAASMEKKKQEGYF
jgi:sulfate adenylyltransferase subunit 2